MRLAFIVNGVKDRKAGQTTIHLAMAAINREHEVWLIGAEDLALDPDEHVRAWAVAPPRKRYKSPDSFVNQLTGPQAERKRITVDELDVVMLRVNPAVRDPERARAAMTALTFATAITRTGTIVLNDPLGLQGASNKLYFHLFPQEVVPRSLITCNPGDIKAFVKEVGQVVLKPLRGTGGKNVFLVRKEEKSNLSQMIEAITRDGYVIAQEYLPEASEGDMRLLLLNGKPFKYKGKYAAVRRRCGEEDVRSNVHAGGIPTQAKVTEREIRIAQLVGPKLAKDGMFLVGLDIIGDKLVEINVFTPGGMAGARQFEGVNFFSALIQDLERKVAFADSYQHTFDNARLATL